MKNSYNIFYSWQSDIPRNRYIIEEAIKKAIKELKKPNINDIQLEINLDRDTKNTSGSPEIADTILNKISNCDIFICDVTLINNSLISKFTNQRLTPNPNVLIELGYAIRHLGWDRIICVNNLCFGKSEDLPFDIRNHRITSLVFNKVKGKQELTIVLKEAIYSIIENYDSIIEKFNSKKITFYDSGIYLKISEICTESFLKDSISLAVNSLCSNNYIYSRWDELFDFYEKTDNHFLDKETHNSFELFLNALDTFRMLCYQKFVEKERNEMTIFDYEEAGIKISGEQRVEILQNERTSVHKDAFENESWPEAEIRVQKIQSQLYDYSKTVIISYQEFIMTFKKKQIE